MIATTERRLITAKVEVRTSKSGNTAEGYAALYNSRSENLGGFVERLAPGAFNRTLRDGVNKWLLYAHDPNSVLSSTDSNTLQLSSDSKGLHFKGTLPNTTLGNDVRELLRTGLVDKMSFGFNVPDGGDDWQQDDEDRGLLLRTVRDVNLFEVSIVPTPAYTATNVGLRTMNIAVTPPALVRKLNISDDLERRLFIAKLKAL